MITTYTPSRCRYAIGRLKQHVYLISAASCTIHIDIDSAWVENLTETPLFIKGAVTLNESTSYDDRFKFQKTVTATVNGFAKLSALGGKYYIVLEDVNGIMWLVNVDFPSLVTYTYTLQDGTDETVFTFSALSNFPTLKLNASINNAYACQNYSLVRVDEIKMLEKRYANLNASSGIVYGYSNQVYKTVRPYRNSIKVEETFDGTNANTTIQFSIGLDDYQSSWHYNMLEYPYNKYVAVIDHLACGYEMGLVPSYNAQGSHQIGGGDTVTVTLVGGSQRGSEWAERWIEVTIAPQYRWELTDEWACQPVEYRWTESGYTCDNANKYQNNIKEVSTDGGETWTVVTPVEYSASTLVEQDSYDCGYRTDTTTGTPYCTGYDKYIDVYYRTSRDNGNTWVTASTSPTLVEANSIACGYIPPTPFGGKYKLVLEDLSVISAECDSTSAITSGEVATQYSGTVVSATIGSCVNTIGVRAFNGCRKLINMSIPDNVISIGDFAFSGCTGLSVVSIGKGVISIGEQAFQGCKNIENIVIPNNVTSIGDSAFWACDGLTAATIGSGATIGSLAFSYCRSLTSVILSYGITTIGVDAFWLCDALTSVTIPASVTFIASRAFIQCSGLTFIRVDATIPPTMGGYSFEYTNNCPIYVPSASVNAYKADSNWSLYADRIQAIPDS